VSASGLVIDQQLGGADARSAYFRDPDGNPLFLMQRFRRGKE
jgi:hypothetical protein